jgi:cytoskeletal protein CcmA (bactofilin family)
MWNLKDACEKLVQTNGAGQPESRVEAVPSKSPKGDRAEGESLIGRSLHVDGNMRGTEDLVIEGEIEGRIELKEHHLTVGASGRVKGDLNAKTVTVSGEVVGNIHAAIKVEISESGKLEGDVIAPRIAIADGAAFKGSVDTKRTSTVTDISASRKKAQFQPENSLAAKV